MPAETVNGGPGRVVTALRADTPQDEPFLRLVYAGTRADELALVDWPESQKQAFVDMQFNAQHSFYHEHFADAQFLVIELEEIPIGRLYIRRRPAEIRSCRPS